MAGLVPISLEQRFGIPGPSRDQNKTASTLREAEAMSRNRVEGHMVADSPEEFSGRLDDLGLVMPCGGHVLDKRDAWLRHLDETHGFEIQLVFGIVAPRMIVEVGVTLARWSGHDDIERADFRFERLFDLDQRLARIPGYEIGDRPTDDGAGLGREICRVGGGARRLKIDRQSDVGGVAGRPDRLKRAQSKSPTAGEKIRQRQGPLRVLQQSRFPFLLDPLQ